MAGQPQGPEALGPQRRLRHVPGDREGPRRLARRREGPSLTTTPKHLTTGTNGMAVGAPRHHRAGRHKDFHGADWDTPMHAISERPVLQSDSVC